MLPELRGLGELGRMLVGQEFEKVAPGSSILVMGQSGGVGGGGGGAVRPQGDIQQFAKQLARKKFGGGHWPELKELVQRESSWNPKADNPTSSAYGLFQFLDSTWENYGGKTNNPYKQIRKGLRYISDRYGDPEAALDFHDKNNWY